MKKLKFDLGNDWYGEIDVYEDSTFGLGLAGPDEYNDNVSVWKFSHNSHKSENPEEFARNARTRLHERNWYIDFDKRVWYLDKLLLRFICAL